MRFLLCALLFLTACGQARGLLYEASVSWVHYDPKHLPENTWPVAKSKIDIPV